jgi:hypothetical protein
MYAVVASGEQLVHHPDRVGQVTALGLDETLFARLDRYRTQVWSTQIVDVRRGQLLDVVPGRTAPEPCRWLSARPQVWRDRIEWATLDLSASYRKVFDTMLLDADQVADPFQVVKLAAGSASQPSDSPPTSTTECSDCSGRATRNSKCGSSGTRRN